MASQSTPPHVLFFPFLAPGHLLPLAHVARLFALHNIKCTILTTPINEIVIRPIIDQTNETIYKLKSSRHLIPVVVSSIPFPVEAGLPVGIESVAGITSFEMQEKFIKGLFLLEKPFKQATEKICPDAMITWPLFSDQIYNEKMIVEILRVGAEVGVKDYGRDLEQKQLIQAETIASVIERVMGEGEEGEGMRQRSKELKEKAKKAVQVGGSSYVDLKNLIEELICKKNAKMNLA